MELIDAYVKPSSSIVDDVRLPWVSVELFESGAVLVIGDGVERMLLEGGWGVEAVGRFLIFHGIKCYRTSYKSG